MHAVSEPQNGRPAAGFGTSSVHLADPGEQLALALVLRPITRAAEKAGLVPEHSTRSLRDWVYKARRALSQTPGGAADMRRINAALATAGAEFVDLGPRACLEMQGVAVEAAVLFVRTCRRYQLAEPEELELAKSYALNLALAKAARARVFQTGFSALSATRTATLDAGGAMVAAGAEGATAKLTTKLPAGGDLAAIAREHDREARISLLTLREVVAHRRSSPGGTSSAAMDAKVEALLEKEARDREDFRKRLAAKPDHVASPPVAPTTAPRPTPALAVAPSAAAPAVPNVAPAPAEPEVEQPAWCVLRGKQVPASLAGKPLPNAGDGPIWVTQQAEEDRLIASWTARRQAVLDAESRAAWARRNR